MQGYAEAEKIDMQISALLGKEPITEENCAEWRRFARTIASSVEIIERKAIRVGLDKHI